MNENTTLCIIFWNLGIGGIQKRIRDIALDISKSKANHRVLILLRSDDKKGFSLVLQGVKNVRVLVYPHAHLTYRPPFGFFFWIAWTLARVKPAVVLTFLPPLTIALAIIRKFMFWIKYYLVFNDGVLLTNFLIIRRRQWLALWIRTCYRVADLIIAPSEAVKKDLVEHFHVAPNTIAVISNWTLFPVEHKKASLYDLIYVGRFDREKNTQSLLNLVNYMRKSNVNMRMALLGEGDLADAIHQEILRMKLTKNVIVFPFSLSVEKYLRRSKILVLPSEIEGMPNVVLEAAMCGVPSVINNFPGAQEVVIDGKTGYVTNSQGEMIRKIRQLLDNPERASRMGRKAQEYVLKHFHSAKQKQFIDALLS